MKDMTLHDFFKAHPKVAVAFSGGVDSSYLLWAAKEAGADVTAYYVKAQFQPEFEFADAKEVAVYARVPLRILPVDILSVPHVADNPEDRCYYCKQAIFGTILQEAARDGYTEILDGTNASDDAADRPGMRALAELQVYSPLRICGLTKDVIRRLSKEAGLKTWDKPAYACLATRIPSGMHITSELLSRTECAESALFAMGFSDFRVRTAPDGAALVQVTSAQMKKAQDAMSDILRILSEYYPSVLLDPVPR